MIVFFTAIYIIGFILAWNIFKIPAKITELGNELGPYSITRFKALQIAFWPATFLCYSLIVVIELIGDLLGIIIKENSR